MPDQDTPFSHRDALVEFGAGLREHDLVDEYHLMVHPVVLGSGKRLFKEGAADTDLALTDCRKAGPDVLLLILRPATTQHSEGSPGQDDSPAS